MLSVSNNHQNLVGMIYFMVSWYKDISFPWAVKGVNLLFQEWAHGDDNISTFHPRVPIELTTLEGMPFLCAPMKQLQHWIASSWVNWVWITKIFHVLFFLMFAYRRLLMSTYICYQCDIDFTVGPFEKTCQLFGKFKNTGWWCGTFNHTSAGCIVHLNTPVAEWSV